MANASYTQTQRHTVPRKALLNLLTEDVKRIDDYKRNTHTHVCNIHTLLPSSGTKEFADSPSSQVRPEIGRASCRERV